MSDQLQNEVSVLRGRVEVLENANEPCANSSGTCMRIWTSVLLRCPQGRARFPPLPDRPAAGAAGADQAAYNQAFDILKAGKYADAITAFQQFLQSWPQSSLADNAQYWLGESYYVTRDFQSAAAAFQTVLDRWPDSRKAPDALVEAGLYPG